MDKNRFLSALREGLAGLPPEDIERSLEYYGEMIDDRIEDGLSEEEAVAAVGPVEEIVSQILLETSLPKLVRARVRPRRALRAWEIVLLTLGSPVWLPLLLALAVIILAVYIVLWAAVAVLYAAVLSVAAGAVAGAVGTVGFVLGGHPVQGAALFGAGLVCAGLAIAMFFGVNLIARGMLLLCRKSLYGIKYIFIGRRDER